MIHIRYMMSGKGFKASVSPTEAAAILSQARMDNVFRITRWVADSQDEADQVARMMTRVGRTK